MIEEHGLTRRYGDFTAVDDVSFSIDDDEIVGILGPNGAGKTTTIRMITGFLPPSEGRVTVAGRDLPGDSVAARRELGYLPENVALYDEMRVAEYLAYRAHLQGVSRSAVREHIDDSVSRCLLEDVRDQIIGTLSKGYRQRVGLATAILHRPKVLVLDEPTIGLDPTQIVAIRELIRELGKESTLLLSTHILPEVELLCDRVMIIDRGKIVAQGSPESLRASSTGKTTVGVTFKDPPPDVAPILATLPQVAGVEVRESGSFEVQPAGEVDPREAIFRAAVDRDWVILELAQSKVSLEDVFVRLTTQDTSATTAAVDTEVQAAEESSEVSR